MKIVKVFLVFTLTLFHQLYAQKPDIRSVNKRTAFIGETLTISGSGFSSTFNNNIVYFGAARATVVSATQSTLELLVPAGATFDQISVTNTESNLTGYSSGKFLLNFNGFQGLEEERLGERLEVQEEDGLFDVCACDFNNDGLNDIVTTNSRDKNYSVTAYINNSPAAGTNISFQRFNDPNFLIGEETRNITCGDLDGDGKPDLVVGKGGNIADRLYLFRNISSGSVVKFASVVTFTANIGSTQAATRRVKIHDLDNDGRPEIIMTDQRNAYVHVFKNNSTPGQLVFSRNDRVLIPGEKITLGLDIADINGDGKPDVVFGSNLTSDVYVAVNRSNNGSLSFDDPVKVPVSGDLMNLVVADIDMDGDQDIIVANFVNNIYVLLNESTETTVKFAATKSYDTGRLPFALDIGDINGDGRPDIVVATNEASEPLTILENKTTNNTLSLYQHYVGKAEAQRNLKIADYSGDGKPDIAFTIDGVNKVGFLRNMHCVGAKITTDPPNKICAGRPSELVAVQARKATYVWKNVTTNESLTSDVNTFDAETPGEYQVTISSESDNCESISPKVLVETGGSNLPPTPTISGPEAVCEGGNFTLASSIEEGVSYHWEAPDGDTYTGSTLEIQNVVASDAGKYSLVLEGDGCRTDPVFKNIDISIIPELEITATQGEHFCEGTANVLKVASLQNGVYLWYKNGQPIDGNNKSELSVSEAGNYAVKFTNQYLCSSQSNAFSVSKVAAPTASFTANDCAFLNQTVTFKNTSTGADGVTAHYAWDLGDENIITEKDTEFTFKSAGTYDISLTVSYGNQYCQDVATKTINVASVEGIRVLVDGENATVENTAFCEGDTLALSVEDSWKDITWSTGGIGNTIDALLGGEYTVTGVLEDNNCQSTHSITLTEYPKPYVEILNEEPRVKKGAEFQFELDYDHGLDFFWKAAGEEEVFSTAAEPIVNPEKNTTYVVVAVNEYNCEDSTSYEVIVEGDRNIHVDAPPVFTPNSGDDLNQTWVINNISNFSDCAIVIMNRYGQKVFEEDSYNNDWDAVFNGKDLPEDTYYYILKCNASEVHTGSITVIR